MNIISLFKYLKQEEQQKLQSKEKGVTMSFLINAFDGNFLYNIFNELVIAFFIFIMLKLITQLVFLVFLSRQTQAAGPQANFTAFSDAKLKTLINDDAQFAYAVGQIDTVFKKHCGIPVRDVISAAYRVHMGAKYNIVFDTQYGPLNAIVLAQYWQKSFDIQRLQFVSPQIAPITTISSKNSNSSKPNQSQILKNDNLNKSKNVSNSTKDVKIQQKNITMEEIQYEFPELKQKCDLMKKQIEKLKGEASQSNPALDQQPAYWGIMPNQSASLFQTTEFEISSGLPGDQTITASQPVVTLSAPSGNDNLTKGSNSSVLNVSTVNSIKVANSTNSTKPSSGGAKTTAAKNMTQSLFSNASSNASSNTSSNASSNASSNISSNSKNNSTLSFGTFTITASISSATASPAVGDGVAPSTIREAAAQQAPPSINKNGTYNTNANSTNSTLPNNKTANNGSLASDRTISSNQSSTSTASNLTNATTNSTVPQPSISPQASSNKMLTSALIANILSANANIANPASLIAPASISSAAGSLKPANSARSRRMLRQEQEQP